MVSIRESSTNLGSADNIANKIGEVLVQFMGKWFDKDAITKIYNTQSYDTYTGESKRKMIIFIDDIFKSTTHF